MFFQLAFLCKTSWKYFTFECFSFMNWLNMLFHFIFLSKLIDKNQIWIFSFMNWFNLFFKKIYVSKLLFQTSHSIFFSFLPDFLGSSFVQIFWWVLKNASVFFYSLTLSDVGRGGQKGNKWECFQKFSMRKVHFLRGLMDKVLDFDTKGP